MKTGNRHRKLFYVPGMISLLLIPSFCLWHFYTQKAFNVERAMDLGLPDKAMVEEYEAYFPKIFKRHYDEFTFNGSLETDKKELSRFQNLLKQRNAIKDTVGGIRLRFGAKMQYDVFIRILDVLTLEDTPTYGIFYNDMLVMNAAPSDLKYYKQKQEAEAKEKGVSYTTNEPPCGNPAIEAEQRKIARENEQRTEKENFRKSFFNRHWYLFLIYFGIVLLNISMLIKFNKNRIYNQKSYI
ncbi:MAG: hypothetical protein QM710_13355 [Flavobacterium sp.]